MVRPTRCDVRRISLRAMVPTVSGFHGRAPLTGRDDCHGATGGDGIMAFAGVEGTVGGDAADLLRGRDLVQQFGQHGRKRDAAPLLPFLV